jgi:type IV secretion system protein VirD4
MNLILFAVIAVILIGVPLGYHSTISRSAMTKHRAWAMHWRIWLRLRPGEGFATLTELWFRCSRHYAAFTHGRRARPSYTWLGCLLTRATGYAVRYGRAQAGRRVFGRMQDQQLILSPQQQGKSAMLADRLIDHPGPVISTSTRDDLFRHTAGERGRRGPVDVWNPLGIGGIPSTFGWNIIDGCQDPATAIRRAQDLTGDYPAAGDMKWWQSKASASLAALLHAAALAPWATMTDVYSWVNRHGDKQAEDILDTAENASPQLRAILEEIRRDGRTADSVRATISESLTWVAIPALAAAASPPPGHGFDVRRFLMSSGSLYLIAPGTETAPVAPLFQAFVQHVHYEAGLIGAASPFHKLDPPLWYALDELTQVCPLPLPAMLADSAGKGILITAVVHSYGQLEQRWGKPGAETIWSTCSTKILLGGITDPVTLEHMTRLCGVVAVPSGEGHQQAPAVPPELLRMLPKWRALILTLNQRPVVVKIRPVWHRLSHRFGRIPGPLPALAPLPQPVHMVPVDSTMPILAEPRNGHPVT